MTHQSSRHSTRENRPLPQRKCSRGRWHTQKRCRPPRWRGRSSATTPRRDRCADAAHAHARHKRARQQDTGSCASQVTHPPHAKYRPEPARKSGQTMQRKDKTFAVLFGKRFAPPGLCHGVPSCPRHVRCLSSAECTCAARQAPLSTQNSLSSPLVAKWRRICQSEAMCQEDVLFWRRILFVKARDGRLGNIIPEEF